ncbi:hypothetical protein FQA39_LY06877 [Lamprigera yunnana]|nr:hypothetical protein FQA39_LY06877 [Lamprigera yunnana]
MPESPYYLLMKNQKEKARESLTMFQPSFDVDKELEEILDFVENDNAKRGGIMDLFKVKSNFKAFAILTVLNISGIIVMFMNMHLILKDAKGILPKNIATIIFAALMLLANIISGSCMYKYGLGLVLIVFTAELYPTNIKAVGVTAADAVYIVSAVSSIAVFYLWHESTVLLVWCLLHSDMFIFYTYGDVLPNVDETETDEKAPTRLLNDSSKTTSDYGAKD